MNQNAPTINMATAYTALAGLLSNLFALAEPQIKQLSQFDRNNLSELAQYSADHLADVQQALAYVLPLAQRSNRELPEEIYFGTSQMLLLGEAQQQLLFQLAELNYTSPNRK